MCAEQIIEYEDFDNQTGGYQVNEYEYEEEDERYGPAEREGEFSLNTEVRAADACRHCSESLLHRHLFLHLSDLTQNLPEKGEKGEPGYLGPVRKTLTHYRCVFVIIVVLQLQKNLVVKERNVHLFTEASSPSVSNLSITS